MSGLKHASLMKNALSSGNKTMNHPKLMLQDVKLPTQSAPPSPGMD